MTIKEYFVEFTKNNPSESIPKVREINSIIKYDEFTRTKMRFTIYAYVAKKARQVLSEKEIIFAIGESAACLLFTSESFIFCQNYGIKQKASEYPIKDFIHLEIIPKGILFPGKYMLNGNKIGMPGNLGKDYINLIQKIKDGINNSEFEAEETIVKDANSVDEREVNSNDIVSREIYAEMDFLSEDEMLSLASELAKEFKDLHNNDTFQILQDSEIESAVNDIQTYKERLGEIIDDLCERNPGHPMCIERKNQGKSHTVTSNMVLFGIRYKLNWATTMEILVTLYEVVIQDPFNKQKATRINIFDFHNTRYDIHKEKSSILFEGEELMTMVVQRELFDILDLLKSDFIQPFYLALKEQILEKKQFVSENIIEPGKKNFLSTFDLDGDGKIDVIHESAFTDALDMKKAELSKCTNDVIQDFSRIREYLYKIGGNCETLLKDIVNLDYEEFRSNPDFFTTGLESLAQQIHNYSIMSVVGIKMISNALEGNMVDYYGLRNIFEQVGVFLTYAEAQQIEKLNVISKTLEKTTDSILQLQSSSNRIQSILLQNQEATNKAMSQLSSQLDSIGKASKVNNVYNAVNTAQLFRISKKIK